MNELVARETQKAGAHRREIAVIGGIAAFAAVLTLILLWVNDGDGNGTQTRIATTEQAPKLYIAPDAVAEGTSRWRAVTTAGVRVGVSSGIGERFVRFDFGAARETFTVAQLTFQSPQDWSGRRFLFLPFRGTASGLPYTFFIDFAADHVNSAAYRLVDTSTDTNIVPFELGAKSSGRRAADWGHVVSVRIATDSKDDRGAFELGAMRLSAESRP